MRVALVTTSWAAEVDSDQPLYERSLAAAGLDVDLLPWREPADWAAYDLIIVRSPWDYCEHLAEFLAWLARVEHLGPPLHNPGPLIRWNLDKRYLDDFRSGGIPTMPTHFATTAAEVRAALAAPGRDEVVVKPMVSAGSRNTGRFPADDPGAVALAQVILADGGVVMIQPFVRSVAEEGEVSLVVFDGEVSHALRRGPILGVAGGRLHDGAHGIVEPTVPTPAQVAAARAAAARAQAIAEERGWTAPGEPLLYGRYDLVRLDDGTEALLEAELFEPMFFLDVDPAAADRFAAAVRRRAERARRP